MPTKAIKDTSRAKDQPRDQRARQRQTRSALWKVLAKHFPVAVRRHLQPIVEAGPLPLSDIQLMALAAWVEIRGDVKKARFHRQLRSLERFLSSQSVMMKFLLSVTNAMGPDLAPGEQPIRIPDGFQLHALPEPDVGGDLVD